MPPRYDSRVCKTAWRASRVGWRGLITIDSQLVAHGRLRQVHAQVRRAVGPSRANSRSIHPMLAPCERPSCGPEYSGAHQLIDAVDLMRPTRGPVQGKHSAHGMTANAQPPVIQAEVGNQVVQGDQVSFQGEVAPLVIARTTEAEQIGHDEPRVV
jgi:hypothetical protein